MSIKLPMIILLYIFSANLNPASSQLIVDHVNLNEREDIIFVQLRYKDYGYKSKVKVSIDFGQDSELTRKCNDNVYNLDDDLIIFESAVGALNHLENNGWSLFAIDNKISGGGDTAISTNAKYLFKRKEIDRAANRN